MSRIQQLAEQAQMRREITALQEHCRILDKLNYERSLEIARLAQAIEALQSIAKPLESPKRPGRPRKDDGGIPALGDRAP